MLKLKPAIDRQHIDALTSILGAEALVSTSLADRLSYSHDASPLSLRGAFEGATTFMPGAVVWPQRTEDVSAILRYATAEGIPVVPFGSGSGIVGGAIAQASALVIDMKAMHAIRHIDRTSMTVTAETGINGQMLEDRLIQDGFTTGHWPQSIRASTLGGWIAHRAAGIGSTGYGKIEDIVQSMEVVLPDGRVMHTRGVPRSSTGPDLNHLFLGGEGAFGIVTAAELAIHPYPEMRVWQAYSYRDIGTAVDVVRKVIQDGIRPAIVRLYDAEEARPLLAGRSAPDGAVLLLWGVLGKSERVATDLDAVRSHSAVRALDDLGQGPGDAWWSHRLSTAGLLATLNEPMGIADALEVSGSWSSLAAMYGDMRKDMLAAAGEGARVFGHVSHVYHTGANLYMIFHAHAAESDDIPCLYDRILDAAFQACLRHGGSISHHHGVGRTKGSWLAAEHGDNGMQALMALQRALDPAGIMNPGIGLRGSDHDA